MSVLEIFEVSNDRQIKKMFDGKIIRMQYKDGSPKKSVVTNFISALLITISNQ